MTIDDERRVALAFFAHPDDAEILCGGTLIRLADRGWRVHIATATPGDCGSPDLPGEEIAGIRRGEAQRAAAQIGAEYHCLELRDVHVCYDAESIGRSIDLFRRTMPALVLTHPRRDYMLDHEQVHLLARNASFAWPIPNASALPLPPGATIPHLYYADPIDRLDPYTRQPPTPTAYVEVTALIDRKLAMLACHESQREWLRRHHGVDEYLNATRKHTLARGAEAGVEHAEAFVQHLGHPYPRNDLLSELFS